MIRLTLRNAVRLALGQVLVVVMGTLGNAATGHWAVIAGQPPPAFPQWLADYGAWFLLLPLLWIGGFAKVVNDPEVEIELKQTIFWVGVGLALVLLLLMGAGMLTPFFTIKELNYDKIDQL